MEVLVADVHRSPVKSLHFEENVTELKIGPDGLFGDREYMLVEASEHKNVLYKPSVITAQPGQFLSQREDPVMTGLVPTLYEHGLDLRWRTNNEGLFLPRIEETPDNLIPVSVWGWKGEAVDQGDYAGQLLSKVIQRAVRLVTVSRQKPRFVESTPEFGRIGFADGYPLLVFGEQSITKVNEQLMKNGKDPVPADRFRGTIILGGIEAWEEDFIEKLIVTDEDDTPVAELERLKACSRCPIPETNQETGERVHGVLRALGNLGRGGNHQQERYRESGSPVFFGQNFIIRLLREHPEGQSVSIHKGMKLQAVMSAETNWIPNAT